MGCPGAPAGIIPRRSGPLGSPQRPMHKRGWIPKRSTGADCKSAGFAFAGSNPAPATILCCPSCRRQLRTAEDGTTATIERQVRSRHPTQPRAASGPTATIECQMRSRRLERVASRHPLRVAPPATPGPSARRDREMRLRWLRRVAVRPTFRAGRSWAANRSCSAVAQAAPTAGRREDAGSRCGGRIHDPPLRPPGVDRDRGGRPRREANEHPSPSAFSAPLRFHFWTRRR